MHRDGQSSYEGYGPAGQDARAVVLSSIARRQEMVFMMIRRSDRVQKSTTKPVLFDIMSRDTDAFI